MSLLIKVIARCLSVVGKRLSESNVTHGRGRLMIFQARQSPSRIDAATVCAPSSRSNVMRGMSEGRSMPRAVRLIPVRSMPSKVLLALEYQPEILCRAIQAGCSPLENADGIRPKLRLIQLTVNAIPLWCAFCRVTECHFAGIGNHQRCRAS